ncbi:MAG: sigma-70 family RNA polymerase sigma factor [Planctomycetes bacterium]|nr:sigma-70 family RNA polymerase sigma factor [Planctomycetota bacterium]
MADKKRLAPTGAGGFVNLEEAHLIKSARKGERSSFGKLVDIYQDRIFRLIYRMTSHAEDARDLTQDTFIKAYKGLASYKGDSKFSTWLYRIAVNTTISHLRKAISRMPARSLVVSDGESGPVELEDHSSETPLSIIERDETGRAIQTAIGSLAEDYRAAIVLRDVEGLSYDEIATLLNVPVGTVRSRIHRARLALKDKLDGWEK